ncbi:MAG: AmmeMemoRadiSam system protein B [Thermoanaerobaculia bacterium]|nr:AmmeMemoRadiSam system protein B [Thermoanaerobaculia bacterium]
MLGSRRQRRSRPAAVAGTFYPSPPSVLATAVSRLLDEVAWSAASAAPWPTPTALIAPHAGYPYSGPVAAHAFVRLDRSRGGSAGGRRRVVVIGPSHYVPFAGIALSGAAAFVTPLGPVEVDREAEAVLLDLASVSIYPPAHEREHSIEVELPFLQLVLGDFRLVPLVVGEAAAAVVGEALERVWDDDTLVVVSSDLTHFLDYDTARARDQETARAIAALSRDDFRPEEACGSVAINGLVWAARRRGGAMCTLDLRSSGDTAGDRARVVGYGAWALAAEVTS